MQVAPVFADFVAVLCLAEPAKSPLDSWSANVCDRCELAAERRLSRLPDIPVLAPD